MKRSQRALVAGDCLLCGTEAPDSWPGLLSWTLCYSSRAQICDVAGIAKVCLATLYSSTM